MPYIVKGEPSSWKESNFRNQNFDYKYPGDLDLRPSSEFHNKIRSRIWEKARQARNEISKRYSHWREIDKTLTTYMPLKDKEETLKEKDPDKPVSIVFPYTYSQIEALLVYLTAAFFQDPIFQYEGVEDDDTIGAMLLERVIRVHCIKTKIALNIHTVLRDCLSYGVGIAIPEWTVLHGKKPVRNTSVDVSRIGVNTREDFEIVDSVIFEGNSLSNIDPYMWLPDPSVSSADIQKSEYVGWVDRTNYMNLLSQENLKDSKLFNVKYLKSKEDKRSTLALDQSERQTRVGGSNEINRGMTGTTSPIDIIKMYVNLIPNEWKLSNADYPQKWYFELASDDVIIACHRADHNHGMYPIGVASPEFDGYSIIPTSRMEILHGLQHTLDFLFNSHIANVRKAINDMLVVDPYLVNIEDLKNPEPGKLIRLRRPAWGRGVDKVVQQLQVNDITRLNISDSAYITQWMDRISGADQSMLGTLRTSGPERLTSSEFQGTRGSAISRLQRIAMVIGIQFMQDIGTMFATHAQQYMTNDTFVSIVGRYPEKLQEVFGGKKNARVTPFDIAINYDLIVRDGSVPGGNFSQSWIDLFKVIGTTPELAQSFDITRIFMYIAQQLGAKNVEDFRRTANNVRPTVMPDEQVDREVTAGNLVPIGQ